MEKLKEELCGQYFDGVSMVLEIFNKMDADIPYYLVFWQMWEKFIKQND